MKICIHYRDQHSGPWASADRDVKRTPQAGDFIAASPTRIFRVVLTLHVLFDADYDAEVFAEVVDFDKVQRKTLGEEVWQG
jgi:hypothetical protein